MNWPKPNEYGVFGPLDWSDDVTLQNGKEFVRVILVHAAPNLWLWGLDMRVLHGGRGSWPSFGKKDCRALTRDQAFSAALDCAQAFINDRMDNKTWSDDQREIMDDLLRQIAVKRSQGVLF